MTFFYDDAPEKFATFSRSFLSMFRLTIASLDWWLDTFPPIDDNDTINWGPTIFFVSYIILVLWILFQVSIAVLLDNFLTASNSMKFEEASAALQEKQMAKQLKNPLDPLLLRISKDYIDDEDLSTRLRDLFKVSPFCVLCIHVVSVRERESER